ncbi:MAG: DVU_1553 family AMP-dependent CoA ligase, partial [Geobacteraceae bacterium]
MEITPLEPWIKAKIGSTSIGADLRSDIDRYQLQKLRETVDYARTRAPFYRSLFKGVGGGDLKSLADIASLPFTTAVDIQTDDLSFLCVSCDEISRVVTLRTSGTASPAKRIHFTEEDLELTTDLFHHGMQALVSPGQRVLILMPGELHGSVGDLMVKALPRMGAEGILHGIVLDDAAAIAEIVAKDIDCLIGIPVQVLGLVRHPDAVKIPRGQIKSVLLSADYVPSAIVSEIERAWGCPVFNHYGMTEMGLGAAVDCCALSGYHIRESDLYFEIVNPGSGLPVPDGQTGEVVFSTLTRKGMPLIRYRTGDLSRFIPEPCLCGTILRRLAWVSGRIRGGVIIGAQSVVTVADLDEALFPLPGLLNFQTEIRGTRDMASLHVTLYTGKDSGSDDFLSDKARHALGKIPAVRAAMADGLLNLASCTISSENWIFNGSI